MTSSRAGNSSLPTSACMLERAHVFSIFDLNSNIYVTIINIKKKKQQHQNVS